MLELARALRRPGAAAGAPEIRFVLFDGEEARRHTDEADFELTRPARLAGLRAPPTPHELRALVLLDFVANRGCASRARRARTPRLWGRLRTAARRVGVGAAFPDGDARATITDDHTPFLRAGIPAIDLIDFDYPCCHTHLRRPAPSLGAQPRRDRARRCSELLRTRR